MDPDEMESELEDQDGKSAKHLQSSVLVVSVVKLNLVFGFVLFVGVLLQVQSTDIYIFERFIVHTGVQILLHEDMEQN